MSHSNTALRHNAGVPRYYKTKSKKSFVAMIGKSGSSSLGKALLEQHFPERMPKFYGADPGNRPGWQSFVPTTDKPSGKVYILVRDPVERFISACAQMRCSDRVDKLLDRMEQGEDIAVKNFHLMKVVQYVREDCDCKFIQFPTGISKLTKALKLSSPIDTVNDASNNPPKPNLTDEQVQRVSAYYKEDLKLYLSL
ncbi:hypothetical protein [Rubellicoccus peritrichatus]|uniref:Sulfotransferase domain-containing protein n=1 Tax=Rubellicoccus peritrichatus TaxID=3080537 RepID=A0AAQ3LEE3_9BACT|nr:hypothetical protein [Puniceicoccus sp. CR14]WOO43162.1 hypothetical protein RZN69_08655 [Puniceicoccus sp. CR14]